MVFDSILNPLLNPLLKLEPVIAILIISLLISVIITLAYRMFTDQKLMKELKGDIKDMQKKMKSLRKEPEKMMKIQKVAMEKNMQYMMKSMKPTLFTFIPIIIIFSWLNTHMGYMPLVDDEEFTVTAILSQKVAGIEGSEIIMHVPVDGLILMSNSVQNIEDHMATWTLKGPASDLPYLVEIEYEGNTFEKEMLIKPSLEEREYINPIMKVKDNFVKQITVSNEKVIAINLFGWKMGWLMTYIIFSIVFSMSIRKIFKIY